MSTLEYSSFIPRRPGLVRSGFSYSVWLLMSQPTNITFTQAILAGMGLRFGDDVFTQDFDDSLPIIKMVGQRTGE